MKGKKITFVDEMKVEVRPFETEDSDLKETEILGKTLYSLISPGTELAILAGTAHAFRGTPPPYPCNTGYASVDKVIATGDKVDQFKPGDIVLNMGNHASHHRLDTSKTPVAEVPSNVSPEAAPFARMCGVSMTTLRTTQARPGDTVFVSGLGLVGNLAAQVFQASGYKVVGTDIDEGRRRFAERCGIRNILEPKKDLREELKSATGEDSCHLVLECSGEAEAVVDAMKIARVGAEIVLIGVPRQFSPDISASKLLQPIFLKYLHLRGGWEWEIPLFPENFAKGSILQNFEHALNLISRKEISVKELITHRFKPEHAQEAYEGLMKRKDEYLGVLFDWQ